MTYKMYKVFLLLVLCCSFTMGAFAQNANSSINGTVKDTHGAIVPGATVTLTNIGTNQALSTTSSGEGYLRFYEPIAGKLQVGCQCARICPVGRRPDPAGLSSGDDQCNHECCQRHDTSHRKGCHAYD